jgi:hypothetical protein
MRNTRFAKGEIFFAEARGVKVTYSCLDGKLKNGSRLWKVKISSNGLLFEAYELSEDQARALAHLVIADVEVGMPVDAIGGKYGFEE